MPEVFLEVVFLPSVRGRGVTVYISPPPYLALAGLGTVVVVVVVVISPPLFVTCSALQNLKKKTTKTCLRAHMFKPMVHK